MPSHAWALPRWPLCADSLTVTLLQPTNQTPPSEPAARPRVAPAPPGRVLPQPLAGLGVVPPRTLPSMCVSDGAELVRASPFYHVNSVFGWQMSRASSRPALKRHARASALIRCDSSLTWVKSPNYQTQRQQIEQTPTVCELRPK